MITRTELEQSDPAASLQKVAEAAERLRKEVHKIIIGQDESIEALLWGIFTGGHVLLIGVPGLAKTLMVQTLADTLALEFSRIQFTPDLMPSDITGIEILDAERKLRFVKGPVFANIILADEINRTPPKTQAALLEAMQEKKVTVAGADHPLPLPFFVLATQNPIEQEGTYPLPEAQLDRFMFNVVLDYPSRDEEEQIVARTTGDVQPSLTPVMDAEAIQYVQTLIRCIPVAPQVISYAVQLVRHTRPANDGVPSVVREYVEWGAGPRASQYLILGAKVHAAFRGKLTPDNEDVRAVAFPVLRHRLIRNYKAIAENISPETVIEALLKAVPAIAAP